MMLIKVSLGVYFNIKLFLLFTKNGVVVLVVNCMKLNFMLPFYLLQKPLVYFISLRQFLKVLYFWIS